MTGNLVLLGLGAGDLTAVIVGSLRAFREGEV
jgi:hypothetical protein